ncbi:F-box only protein 10 isoform X1 [Pelodiscus sinensis]|uniref:F-box only protein 10 isoform X1 n=1 Tax=Pelodiscus sinensis TaxID=13735 RepID=UPI003F6A774E
MRRRQPRARPGASPRPARPRAPLPGCGGPAARSEVTMEISGLPVELWRLILSYLRLPDLGRCSLVCKAWYELILSLDNTRWRQLCLGCTECRHPNWPSQPDVEPRSWREAFKQHYVASQTWAKSTQDFEAARCLHAFRRRKDRRVLRVGPGCALDTLRAALAAAGPYDRILLLPGVYEEQSEVPLKVPVEVVGQGKLGDVALLASIDQHCPTARLCNLVFMPAWFSPVVYKTTSGHVQFDNCNFESGQLRIHAPGTCQVKFCTFSQSSVHLHSVALGLLENCEFLGSETASVTVEGPPTSERNWACKHLAALAQACPPAPRTGGDLSPLLPASQAGRGRESAGGSPGGAEDGAAGDLQTDSSDSEPSAGSETEADEQAAYRLSYRAHGPSHRRAQAEGLAALQRELALRTLPQELQRDREAQALASSLQGCLIRKCLFRDGKGGVFVCSQGRARLEGSVFRELTYAVRCIQSSKVVMLQNDIHHCKASGVFLRLAAGGLIAANNIHSNGEAGVDIRKGANPLILCNQIHSGLRSGIVVLGNGKGVIRSNQIYGNREAGVYILYNGNPVVSGNHIFQGLAAGVAVNENGRGQIIENVIRENQWGGADIRRGGDPVLRSNLICCGYSDGVVVGERGKGLIEGNTIYGNKGCGVWIMASSLPHVTNNRIGHNSIYGVAVFCRKDEADDYPAGQGGHESFGEEGEAAAWESDLESEDERFASRRPLSVALVESNSISHNGAAGLYVKSSEALNVIGNAIHANREAGVAVLQSGQLTRIANNSISCNSRGGVLVESAARVELRGNGIYDNRSHGIASKGDGLVVENDILGNRGCGLRLLQAADMKVTKNRIQSFGDYGIAMLDQSKGLVQDNLIFQGRSQKTILQQVSTAEDCVVQNNQLLTAKSRCDIARTLENPPARPHLEGSAPGSALATNAQKGPTVSTRIAARMDRDCHSEGSIFCTLL